MLAKLVVAGGYGHLLTTGTPTPDTLVERGERIEAAARSCIDFTRAKTGAPLPRGLANFSLGYTVDDPIETNDPFVALWVEWQATKATYERAKEKFNTTWDKANFEQRRALSERDQSETFGRMMDVYSKIIATPATTLFGVVVKLRFAWEVTAWELGRDRDELDVDRLNVEHKMLRSVLAEAERLAGEVSS